MGVHDVRPCPCGSGKPSQWTFDARGIPLFRTCGACMGAKLKKVRPDVLTDPDYWSDEPIEPEEPGKGLDVLED